MARGVAQNHSNNICCAYDAGNGAAYLPAIGNNRNNNPVAYLQTMWLLDDRRMAPSSSRQ